LYKKFDSTVTAVHKNNLALVIGVSFIAMNLKVIITGATGFVGEGVLLECLEHPDISEILMINRRPFNLKHPKLKELVAADFFQIDQYTDHLKGYDTCFYCAGISSAGMSEKDYTRITYDTTITFANTLLSVNPQLIFCFISGSHTDSSENGKVMWARVKGKTENALSKMPFKQVYHFRPGGMIPSAGQQNAKTWYRIVIKLMAILIPKQVNTLKQVGLAMINAALKGSDKQVLEVADIKMLAKEKHSLY
jgi:hypothetical protein